MSASDAARNMQVSKTPTHLDEYYPRIIHSATPLLTLRNADTTTRLRKSKFPATRDELVEENVREKKKDSQSERERKANASVSSGKARHR